MRASQAGDAAAYRQLLVAIEPRIRSLVRARVRDASATDDVVQNSLLSIHRGRASYRPERPFGPWMRAIVRNSIVDHFRERKRRGDREIGLPIEDWPDDRPAHDAGDGSPLAPELAAALAALPETQRVAVTLLQVEGLSVAEAALKVGVSPGALKVRAHRGYQALRTALADVREDGEWSSARPPRPVSDSSSRGAE
jgi:RNA polymerase sigma-70 factor (ECF subfamily)